MWTGAASGIWWGQGWVPGWSGSGQQVRDPVGRWGDATGTLEKAVDPGGQPATVHGDRGAPTLSRWSFTPMGRTVGVQEAARRPPGWAGAFPSSIMAI